VLTNVNAPAPSCLGCCGFDGCCRILFHRYSPSVGYRLVLDWCQFVTDVF
jgi:hypothetical protein